MLVPNKALVLCVALSVMLLSCIQQAAATEKEAIGESNICFVGGLETSGDICKQERAEYVAKEAIFDEKELLEKVRQRYAKSNENKGPKAAAAQESPGECGTPLLIEVGKHWDNLSSEAREEITSLMSSEPPLPLTYTTTHFKIYYTNVSEHASGFAYIQSLGQYLENAWSTEVNNFGFNPPVDSFIDVKVYSLGGNVFGETGYNKLFSTITMKIDNSLSDPDLKMTAAHEFFHAVQTAYDYFDSLWIIEGTAKWMEDAIYDNYNTYVNYFGWYGNFRFLNNPDKDLTSLSYEAVLFWKYFSENLGTDGNGNACWQRCGDTDCGIDIMKNLMQKTSVYNGAQAVDKVLQEKFTSFPWMFMEWARANYIKDLGSQFSNGYYDYCEDEEASYESLFTPAMLLTLNAPIDIIIPTPNVTSWGADYIEIYPHESVGVIQIGFYGQDNGLFDPHDFMLSAAFIKGEKVMKIANAGTNANNDVVFNETNYGYDKFVVIVAGKNYGGTYRLMVKGMNDCRDGDGDGHKARTDSCHTGTDCNDNNANIYPSRAESCNGIDDDCDSQVDEGFDKDNDGFTTCGGDCNDNNADIRPGAPELCNSGIDDDCDGQVDEGCTCANGQTRQCGTDVGRCESGMQTCSSGQWSACEGGVPPMAESCPNNGKDDDCDGQADEINCGGVTTRCDDHLWWEDASSRVWMVSWGYKCANIWNVRDIDGDGHMESYLIVGQSPFRTWSWCHAGTGYDVSDFEENIGGSLGCTAIEEQVSSKDIGYCDTDTETTYYDKFYTEPAGSIYASSIICRVSGTKLGLGSIQLFDDAGEPYIAINCGVDADCPSDKYCYKPAPSSPTTYYCKSKCGNGVCDPGEACPSDGSGPETCDGKDNDCNGVVDDGIPIACASASGCPANGCYSGTYKTWECINPGTCTSVCAPTNHVTDADMDGYDKQCDNDCDDNDAGVRPGAVEACDGKDNDCDGSRMPGEIDADSDGFMVCQGDCNDNNRSINPGANETCDGLDNDCNGLVDELCCHDECAAGEKKCDGTRSYTCGNHDDDMCVEWGEGTGCVHGCLSGICTECSASADCPAKYCGYLDGCYSGTYRKYPNSSGTCLNNSCVEGACGAYTEISTDADMDGYDTQCDNDCNDSNSRINPGADEKCNGIDDNCDGRADEICLALKCGDTVSGKVILTSDVLSCPGDGLKITSNGTKIDCAGHVISGMGKGAGINNSRGYVPTSVSGCHILNFRYGIFHKRQGSVLHAGHNNISNCTLENNRKGILLWHNWYNSLSEISGKNNTVGLDFRTSHFNTMRKINISRSSIGMNLNNSGQNNMTDISVSESSTGMIFNGALNWLYGFMMNRNNIGIYVNISEIVHAYNGEIKNSAMYDVYLAGNDVITLVNSTYDKYYIGRYGTLFGTMYRQWHLAISIKDRFENPVPGANIVIRSPYLEFPYSATADSGGKFSVILIDYRVENLTTGVKITRYNPYRINITHPKSETYLQNVTITGDTVLDVKLNADLRPLQGDVDNNCIVNIFDMASVGLAFGSVPGQAGWNPSADMNNDGIINIFDLATVGLNFGRTC